MSCYLVQPRAQILAKGYGCLSFAKNINKSLGKIISKVRNFLIKLHNFPQMHLKLLQKKKLKKQQNNLTYTKQTGRAMSYDISTFSL